jgi:hypothetical protein
MYGIGGDFPKSGHSSNRIETHTFDSYRRAEHEYANEKFRNLNNKKVVKFQSSKAAPSTCASEN